MLILKWLKEKVIKIYVVVSKTLDKSFIFIEVKQIVFHWCHAAGLEYPEVFVLLCFHLTFITMCVSNADEVRGKKPHVPNKQLPHPSPEQQEKEGNTVF